MTTPKMMPGQKPYTEAEYSQLLKVVNELADATSSVLEDELERYARERAQSTQDR